MGSRPCACTLRVLEGEMGSVFCRAGLWLVAIAVLSMCVVAGCARKAKDEHVIRVVRNIGGREGFRIHWEAWKKKFEANNPGWTMELVDLGNSNPSEYYKTRGATGDLPEVLMCWNYAGFLADNDYLVPLPDSFYQQFGIPLPAAYKGKRYTSQAGIQIQGICINKKMWAEIGVTTPPQTWDEFVADLRKLKAKGYQPIAYGGREWSAFVPLFYAMHVDMYDHQPDTTKKPSWTRLKDEGKVRFATDPTARLIMKNMVAFLNEFAGKGAASDGYNEEQRDFYSGKAATGMMGCWVSGDIAPNKVKFDTEFWPLPSMVGRKPVFWCSSVAPAGWAVSTTATGQKREMAIKVLETFYDPEVYQLFLNGEGQLSNAKSVAVKGPKSDWKPTQYFYDSMQRNMATYGVASGAYVSLDDLPPLTFDQALARVMQEILAGETDVDKLLKMLDEEWETARKS